MNKKILGLLLSGMIIVLPAGVNANKRMSDISGNWAETQIQTFVDKGYVGGYADGTFKPNNSITRAEFVSIVNNYFGLTKSSGKVFSDTKTHWAKSAIDIAVTNGVCNGMSTTEFRPNDPITREQTAVMIANYKKIPDTNLDKLNKYQDVNKVSSWAKASVEGVIEKGYMGAGGTAFNPKNNITRAETVVTLSRITNTPSQPPVSNTNTIIKNQIATISTNGLNIRKGPNTNYESLFTANKDQVVLLKEKDSNNWYKVELPNGVVGWCNGTYLTTMKYFNEYCLPSMNETQLNDLIEKTIAVSMNQLGKPYVWDTQGPNSFDCSGLMQYSFKNGAGIELTDYSAEQALKGNYVPRNEVKRGDLVFFDIAKKGRVSHVGLYLGNGEFIQALNPQEGIKISKLSEAKYSTNYVTARRVIK